VIHCIVGASYVRDNGPQVVLMLRSESGERTQLRFPYSPYFFINQNDFKLFKVVAPSAGLEKFKYQSGFKGVDGAKLLKVIVPDPYNIGLINKAVVGTNIKLYESNIPFHYRFMIDKGYKTGIDEGTRLPVECESRHRIVYIDIEMLADKAPKEPLYPIVVVGIYDQYTKTYHSIFIGNDFPIDLDVLKTEPKTVVKYPCRTEEELFSIFSQLWSKLEPDVVVSFSPFDMENIVKRMNILGIDNSFLSPIFNVVNVGRLHIHCVEIVDYAELYRKVFGEPVWNTLDYISNKEIGYGKLPMPSVVEGWKSDYRSVVEYNLRDVELLKDLEDKLGMIKDYLLFIWKNTGLSFSDCLIPNRIGDILHLRHSAGKEIFLSVSDITGKKYTGALVLCDKPGLYDYLLVLDWNELYPSIMDTFHISYDSFNPLGDISIMEGVGFSSTSPGATNEIMVPLRKYRQEVKSMAKSAKSEDKHKYKMLNAAIKVIINGLYGLYGQKTKNFTSRFYDPRIAGAITFIGRDILIHASQILKSINYSLVYADTDSLFIQLKGAVDEVEYLKNTIQSEIANYIKEKYKVDARFRLDMEYIFSRVLILAKKRYHGITTTGDKVIKGLNIIRKDVALITVEQQEKVGDMRLSGVPVTQIHRHILNLYNKVSAGKVPLKDIAVMGRCSKSEYAMLTRNQKAVEYANYRGLDIATGERFFWVYIKALEHFVVPKAKSKERKIIDADVIAFKDPDKFPDGLQIDYKRMADYTIKSPLMPYIGSEECINDHRISEYFNIKNCT